jgi:glycerophosphoryl diester phosphodiesterase
MDTRLRRAAILTMMLAAAGLGADLSSQTRKLAIAHRGASGYAPEHTLASYRLAMEQHADFVEPDLAVSKDGVLICLHDDTLERTTDIARVFPDRPSANVPGRGPAKRWLANDFTVAEIKRLDAGAGATRNSPASACRRFRR